MSETLKTLLEKNPQAVAASVTLAEFLAALPDDAQAQRLAGGLKFGRGYHVNQFLTMKHHGPLSRPLDLPCVTDLADLFEAAKLVPMSVGNQMFRDDAARAKGLGWCFIAGRPIGSRVVPFESLGFRREIVVRNGGKFFCHSLKGNGETHCTYVRPTEKLRKALGVQSDLDLSCVWTFEAIRWADGRTLITGRAHNQHTTSTYWLAVIPQMPNLVDWLPIEDGNRVRAAWQAADDAASCVDGETVDLERAAKFGFNIRTRK